ncbi:phage tail protein [uncultured Staphylococcus sp.]|uniref:phage tail protein n=1 Tax=uncultured Staphylococcus sp. TaxID=189668 RepID=UPI0026008460|nr:phage tail protein [uncultured Staphylococcus sp.]
MQKKYIAVVQPANDKLEDGQGLLLADLQEGGHTIKSDLAEMISAGKTDIGVNSVKEEIKLTVGHIPTDKGQQQLKNAVKNGEQLRVWLFETKKYEDGYHGTFAYVHTEEYEKSFDDEDDKIEIKLSVKWNSADGVTADLPPEWLNPSAAAEVVEWENPGEKTGSYENRKPATTGTDA